MSLQISDFLHGTDQHSVESGLAKSLPAALKIPFRLSAKDVRHRQQTFFARVMTGRGCFLPQFRPEFSRIHIDALHVWIMENGRETIRSLKRDENPGLAAAALPFPRNR